MDSPDGRQERHQGRDRVEYSHLGLQAVVLVDNFEYGVVVRDQGWDIVVVQRAEAIPPVVSLVVHDQVEVVDQPGPEGVIEIDRQPISVAHDEPRAVGVAVTPQNNGGVAVHLDIESGKRLGQFPLDFLRHEQFASMTRGASLDLPVHLPAMQIIQELLRKPGLRRSPRCRDSLLAMPALASAGTEILLPARRGACPAGPGTG